MNRRCLVHTVALAWVLCVSAAANPLVAPLEGYARRVWHTQDGLPEETIQAFAQTRDRFLWIGTSGGLVRFDGAQFVVFDRDNTPALRESSIFCLLTARDGTLWIGTEGGGLVSYQHGRFRLWSKADGLTNGYVRVLRQDHTGDTWIGTDDGLFRLHSGKIERRDGRDGVPLSSIHSIYEDRRHRLWAGGFPFFVLEGDRVIQLALPGGPNDNVKSILEGRDGTIWVGSVSGLERMAANARGYRFERVRGIHSTVRTLLEGNDGTLWIGTIGEGLIRYKNGKFSTPPKLPSNTILSSFLGSENNIWVGTQTGLVRLNRSAISTFALPDFADADFGTITQDRDGALWVGSSHLFHITANGVEIPKFPAPLSQTRVRTVFRDSSGVLWLGTEGRGVFRWSAGALEAVANTQPYIRAFAEDHQGGIWIGTDGGYCRWTPRALGCFEPHESVRALLVDRSGNVWVGKDRGLTRLRSGTFTADAPIARLQSEKIWAIHEDSDGGLWFGTRSSGLFRWRDGKLSSYTTAQGLASNSIYQILEDRRGTFWISGPNGISSIGRSDLENIGQNHGYLLPVKLYGASDGLETTQMYGGVQPAGCITSDGEIWFPGTAGPVRIGPDPGPSLPAPPAVIYRVMADGREVATSGTLDFPAGEGKLEVQYSAIQLRSQDRLRFRYQLEGFDRGWTETRVRRVVYANIPPGHYRFRLLAFDIDRPQTVSEADVLFNWRPHFYQTHWFFVLCASLLAALIWGIHRMRMQQAHARFRAVLEERNRLAREMHDTLIQGCTGVSALLEAMASTQHDTPESGRELLDCARLQIRKTADESRRAVWNLRQSGSEHSELCRLLEQMAQQASFGSNVPVRFESSGKAPAVDPLLEHDLVMVGREAVYNAVRHARPREVRLEARFEASTIRLRVIDDGCGFDPAAVFSSNGEHFGLIGIRERTERLGGRFELRSKPGEGTEIEVSFPIHPQSDFGRIASKASRPRILS